MNGKVVRTHEKDTATEVANVDECPVQHQSLESYFLVEIADSIGLHKVSGGAGLTTREVGLTIPS